MVHRPADSRLLTNLLSQEKEYTKQLSQVLDSSNASLASFSAYAAASPPPTSTVIMSVVGSLAAADEALRRYTRGVEEWREMMKLLKEAEDEVGNIVRDREILVNRLLKASKSERKSSNTNFRDSLLLGHNRLPSSTSSLSLSVGNPESPSPSPSRPLSASFNTSSKLAAAQAELQACENHLATKERELALKRCATVRDGLGLRIRALMECGWVWAEVGKQALQALEELKVDSEMEQQHPSLPVSVSSPSRRPPLSGIGERRISSLLDINEDHVALPEHEGEHDQEHDREHEHDHDHEPSDLSSISPSQSASQRGDGEPLPPPISIGTLLRQLDPNALGEASGPAEGGPSILHHLQDTVFAEDDHDHDPQSQSQRDSLQVQHQSMRSSGFSMATTTSSMYYSPAQPATYKVETMTYAPAVALHVPGTSSGSGKGKGKEKEVEGLPLPSSEVPPPAGSELFKESVQLHTTMRIPAPHAMNDEYAYRIPTAHPSPPPAASHSDPSTSEAHSSPSGSGHQVKRRSCTSPLASPTRASLPQSQAQPSSSYTRSNLSQPQHHPQLFSITAPRRVLERRITEEDIRKLSHSSDRSNEGEEGSSLEEEETRDESKLVKEGKLEVVENPRFMSEERKREVERERRRREEAERKRREREEREARDKEAKEREKEREAKEGTKEKKRFGFFHSSSPSRSQTHPQPQSRPPQQAADGEDHEHEQHVRFSDERAGSPSKLKHPQASPSKGRFLGGLKTFFGGKQSSGQGSGQTPSSSPQASPVAPGHGHSRSLSLPRANSDLGAGAGAASSSEDEDEDPDSDTGRKGGKSSGGFALFGGRKSKSKSKKKDKHIEKGFWGKDADRDQGKSGHWTTRTDKNIREIVQRRGSYDAAIPSLSRSASGSGSGSIGRSLGRGIASDAVLNAGKPPSGSVRNRTVSDVGVSTPASSIGVAGGRRLKKPRSGAVLGGAGGSPTEPSAASGGAGVGGTGHAQESSGSTTTSAGGGTKSTSPPKVPSSILKSRSSIPAPLAARRSASVDDSASLSRRRSWVGEYEEDDLDGEGKEEEGEGEGEGDAMIVDLGWRRRTASEVTPSPTTTPTRGRGASAAKPVKSALVKPKSSTPLLDQSGKSKDYSSDTAAMASASQVPSQGGVRRKKSLTKKRGQGPATTLTTSSAAAAAGAGSSAPSTGTTGPKSITIPPVPATMPPVPTAPPPPSSSLSSGGLLNPVPTAPSPSGTSSATSTPTKKPGLKPPSSVSSSPYGTQGSHRGSQSMSTLATVLPANKNIDRPSGGSPQTPALSTNGGTSGSGGLSRNSSITSAASAPPRVGAGAGSAGRASRHLKQSSLGQGVTSAINGGGGGGGPGSGLVRRSSSGMVPTTSSSASAASTPSKIPSKAASSTPSGPQSLMSIVDGVSRANKEGSSPSTSKTKMLKSAGGTQKPAGLVELGSVKAPERVRREALEGHDVGLKGMASTSSLATVTPANANVKDAKAKLGSGAGSGSGLFEIKAPGSVFEARDLNLPEPQAQNQPQQQSSASVTLAQPQPQKVLAVPAPRREPQPQPGQRHPPSPEEDLQIWATGTVPTANGSSGSLTSRSGSGSSSKIPVMKAPSPSPSLLHSHSPSPKPSSPSPLRSVLKNATSRSPSPGVAAGGASGRVNGVQQAGPVSASSAPRDTAPPPADGTLPWGSDGSLKQPEGTTGGDKGKGKEKEQDVVPPSPVDDVDGTSDTETYETGNESFSEHEQEEESSRGEEHHGMPVPAAGPAVIVSQADSPSTSKLPNGVANGHAVGYDHGGSPKTSSVLSQAQSDTSTVRGASQTLQPPPAPTPAPAPAGSTTGSTSSTASGPRRRKSVRVSLQPTYSPSPPAIEYTPDEEQKEFSPWSSRDDSQKLQHAEREQQRAGHHHPHHPLPKPTTIATQLLSSSRPAQVAPHSASAGHAASGEVERVRDMWADSSESEDEQYKRAKRLLSRAAKKEKDVHLLVANRTR